MKLVRFFVNKLFKIYIILIVKKLIYYYIRLYNIYYFLNILKFRYIKYIDIELKKC